ncbi:ATP-dependent protease, partial [bacterium]|nr:ATP-dependent protease [bacterium]
MSIFKKSLDTIPISPLDELRTLIESARMPEGVQKVADRELYMLSKINPAAVEYTIGITFIEYLASLPWNNKTNDILDLKRAGLIMDQRHYGLQKIKERILE